ncbi:acyl-CoA N-acyltransferase [Roridomyces roridus]|uniref:Acyl-CoA N-acyltransferase n=1 Tax=Roridomyces roridus TaxID=1738132 RepID=A0AAD7FNL0_9AGAR|nr:acyl-CoA N-acyltransferase [Roridomyces roridus]
MILSLPLPSTSGRLELAPPEEKNDVAVAALRSHPETRRHLPFFPTHLSAEEARVHRLSRVADPTRIDFHILLRAEPSDSSATKFVGMTSISHIEIDTNSCEIGIIVSPDSFREGIATEALYTVLAYAFDERKFYRAAFLTAADNAGMRGWLDKAGATLETLQRSRWYYSEGKFTETCSYSILEDEWANTVKARLEERMNRGAATKV